MRRKMTCQLGAVACRSLRCDRRRPMQRSFALTTDVPPYLSTTQGVSPIFFAGHNILNPRNTWRTRDCREAGAPPEFPLGSRLCRRH